MLAPRAADVQREHRLCDRQRHAERALLDAHAALGAGFLAHVHLAVLDMDGVHRAALADEALLAAAALLHVIDGQAVRLDAEVIEGGLHAAVWAAADGDFELVGQGDVSPAGEERVIQVGTDALRVGVAVDAGGALAGGQRADFRAGAADDEADGLHVAADVLDVLKVDAGHLDGETGGEADAPVAVLFGAFGEHGELLGAHRAVFADGAGGKGVGAAVMEEAHRLDAGDLLRVRCSHRNALLYLTKSRAGRSARLCSYCNTGSAYLP